MIKKESIVRKISNGIWFILIGLFMIVITSTPELFNNRGEWIIAVILLLYFFRQEQLI